MNTQLQDAFQKTGKALHALQIILKKPVDPDRAYIDASIHRFKFSIELFWKLLKRILETKGVMVQYPKDVLCEAYAGKLIADENMWLGMLTDRNRSSHTYDETMADEIYHNIGSYYPVMQKTFDRLAALFAFNTK